MCNLYRTKPSAAEVAALFRAPLDGSPNVASEVYPGYSGLVIAEGSVRSMVWGFPLVLNSKKTGEPLKPKPVNNARSDKLTAQRGMWKPSFEARRCLIPLSAWAEAEGPKGNMTRTWMSLPDAETFAVAGIWRDSAEWGPCYSMVMTDAAGEAAKVHNRMPVILAPDDYQIWTSGDPASAEGLCKAWEGDLNIARTSQPWSART